MIVKIATKRTLTDLVEIRVRKTEMVFYSAKTCWWTTDPDDLCCEHGQPMRECPDNYTGIPLDPAGAPLLQTDKVESFLQDAENNLHHYGKHGIAAFILAYHGNIVSDDEHELPRCAVKWDRYNELLDAQP